jgi:hypothetical protein
MPTTLGPLFDLAVETFNRVGGVQLGSMSISVQRPGTGLVHHSDRGVQYASADYRKMMQSAGLSQFCGSFSPGRHRQT